MEKQKKYSHFNYWFLIIFGFLLLIVSLLFNAYLLKDNNNINRNKSKQFALLGDIGGTNIRFQLVQLSKTQSNFQIIKQSRLKVKDFVKFQKSIQQFLKNINQSNYPSVLVIAVAGPVTNNKVSFSNVPQWGLLDGNILRQYFNVSSFKFVNDFEAVSFGLQIIQDSQIVYLTEKTLDKNKIQGVIGPGTGLGHSILFRHQSFQNKMIVLPSEAGHSDFPLIDQQSLQYFNYLKQKLSVNYITLQRSFCGPTIPYIYGYLFKKINGIDMNPSQFPSSEQIMQKCVKQNSEEIYQKVFQFYMKYYSSAIGNFAISHLPYGGIYLVGSLTNSIIHKIQGYDILKGWKERQPEMKKIVDQIPIVFCKQIDLGLKGTFVLAKRQLMKNYNAYKQSQSL